MIVSDMIAALLIAVLSGMGVGSGGLLVLYLTMVRSTPQLQAQFLNLLFFIFASAASLCIHLTRRRIRAIPALLLTATGLCGSLLGARLAISLPEVWVSRLFGLFLLISGAITLARERGKKAAPQRR
jgi:uncharacterized membrane protein YfcA